MTDLTPKEEDTLRHLIDKTKKNSGEEEYQYYLTKEEVEEFRGMLEQEKKMRWLWASMRIWSAWVAGGVVAAYSMWEVIGKFFKAKGLG